MASRLSEIKAVLLTSGVQQTNQPLWQAINQLLDYLIKAENDAAASGAGSGGSSAVASQILQLLFQELGQHDDWILIPGPRGLDGIAGLIGPPGQDGIDGEDAIPIPGQKGDTGLTGPPGMDGDCGGCDHALLGIPSDTIPSPGSGESFTEQTTTATGTEDDFDLDGRWTYLRCNNASALIFTGFTVLGGTPESGDLLIIDNIGSSTVQVLDEDAGSTAANQVICESAAGQIVGAGGRMLCIYDITSDRWRLSCISPGDAIDVAFNAANFTTSGSTWTVEAADVVINKFLQEGIKVTYFVTLSATSVGVGAGTNLAITLPNSFTVANQGTQVGPYGRGQESGGTHEAVVYATIAASSTLFQLIKVTNAAWANTTNTTNIQGSAVFLVD